MMMKNMNNMRVAKGGIRQRNTEQSNRDRYAQHHARYLQSQFTYNTHTLLKRICENGQKQPYMYGIPLYKIMLEVVKIMMMNELETLFLGSTLQEMKWKITDPCLNEYVADAIDITPQLQKDTEARRVQFSLLLISYIVKMYLNDEISLFDFKIRQIIKNGFDRMYQTWVNRVSSNFRFNPKNMNKIFKEYDTHQHENNSQIIDYNKLVAEYFKQSDANFFDQRQQEIAKPQEEEQVYKPVYQNTHHENNSDNYQAYRHKELKSHQKHSDINQLPLEEEEEVPPQNNERRQSLRLANKSSEIGFFRRESGNQFFAPEGSRGGIFNLSMMRSSKMEEESPRQ